MPRTFHPHQPPEALLLDFGGVVMLTSKPDGGADEAARAVAARLARAGHEIPTAELAEALQSGRTALKHWKHAASRRRAPREMAHREIVADFLASDLPDGARELLVSEAVWLLDLIATTISDHEVRAGVPELLATAREHGIPVGIVSNAHSGRSHRALLAAHGLDEHLGVQVYSDEVGVRKPNPAIMRLATDALGADPARCWYVGDTFDRDVVAARRAGIGTVLLTRSQHTHLPPFVVREQPDAVFEDPTGVLTALRTSVAGSAGGDGEAHAHGTDPAVAGQTAVAGKRGALLIDHGGVISTSGTEAGSEHAGEESGLREIAGTVSALLSSPEEPLDLETALSLVAAARAEAKILKLERQREVEPSTFWVELVGKHLSTRQRALLATEAHQLTFRLGVTKSRRTLREGVRALLTDAGARDLPVVVVSNTISGLSVRSICEDHGIDHLIAAYICSDEFGSRKPDPELVRAALRAVDAEPALSWFVGDKPHNDAAAARAAGVPNRVLVRGGSTGEGALAEALTTGLATAVVDHPGELRHLFTPTAPAEAARADGPAVPTAADLQPTAP